MALALNQLESGISNTSNKDEHRHHGVLNWGLVSIELNRSMMQCSTVYKDEKRRIADLHRKTGRFSPSEVCFAYMVLCLFIFTLFDILCSIIQYYYLWFYYRMR